MQIPYSPREVVRAVTHLHPLVADGGSHWIYENNHWQVLEGSALAWFQRRLLEHNVFRIDEEGEKVGVDTSSPGFIGAIDRYIDCAPEILRSGFFSDAPTGITYDNGFLEMRADGSAELREHGPQWRSRIYINATYDSAATCPYTREVLASYFTEDKDNDGDAKQRAILEFLALCLLGRANADNRGVMLWVTGIKGSGKTTLMQNLVEAVFHPSTMAAVEPDAFSRPNDLAKLVGKLINFRDEIGNKALRDVGTIKAVLSGATVSVKKLYKDVSNARITCGHLFVANDMPVMADASGALQDRMIHVHVTHSFKREYEHAQDVASKMKAERVGILNMLLDVYRSMLARGGRDTGVLPPASAIAYRNETSAEADAFQQFVDDCCTHDDAHRVRSAEILQTFNSWKDLVGMSSLSVSANLLGRKVREKLPKAYGGRSGQTTNIVYHIRLREPTHLLSANADDFE